MLEIDSQMDVVKTSQCSQVVKAVFMSLVGDTEAIVERLQPLASRQFNCVGVVSRGHSSEVLGIRLGLLGDLTSFIPDFPHL